MKKKTTFILILIMTGALLGIMLLQLLWLNKQIDASQRIFSNKVHLILARTAEKIREKEHKTLYNEIADLEQQAKKIPRQQSFSIVKEDPINNQFYVYKQEVLIEESIIPLETNQFKNSHDSISVINEYWAELRKEIPKISKKQTPKSLSRADYELLTSNDFTLDRYIRLKGDSNPLEKRVSNKVIDSVLKKELQRYNLLNADYRFAILKPDSSLTKLATKGFRQENKKTYYANFFCDFKGDREYLLSIYFPKWNEMVNRPVFAEFLLASILMIIVISVFGASLYYIRKQRKNSEIKDDFVNNITHEFKTPIATIGVALESLKNKNILNSEEKINHYTKIIKKQNERLNLQVGMVLRMSQLKKNQIELDLRKVDLNEIVRKAVDEIRLIIQHRKGKIFEEYSPQPIYVKVDTFHLKNVTLNVLDNANKYSPDIPVIKVNVYKENNYACVAIEDRGIGMSRSVQKRIFEEFYRSETGNIHNVKGSGLGLSYLKKIIVLHGGKVEVQSEKNKGSKFIIKIPV